MNTLEFILTCRDEAGAVIEGVKKRVTASQDAIASSVKQSSSAQQAAQNELKQATGELNQKTRDLTDTLVLFGKRGEKIPDDLSPLQRSLLATTQQMHGLEMAFSHFGGIAGLVIGTLVAAYKATIWLSEKMGHTSEASAKNQIEQMDAAKRKLEEFIAAQNKIDDERLKEVFDYYKRIGEDAENAAQAIERVAAAQRKLADATHQDKMLGISIDEEKALRAAGGDVLSEERVKVLFSAKRRDADTDYSIDSAKAEVSAAERTLELAKQKETLAKSTRDEDEMQILHAETAIKEAREYFLSLGKRPEDDGGKKIWDAKYDKYRADMAVAQHTIDEMKKKEVDERHELPDATRNVQDDQVALAAAQKLLEEAKKRKDLDAETYAAEAEAFNRRLDEEAAKEQDAAQKTALEQMRLDKERADKQLQLMIDNLKTQEQAERAMESDAASRLKQAHAEVARTWAWYKDPKAWQNELKAERADVAAQKQFEQDANRLESKYDWRTSDNLSDSEEIVRRVLLSREEEAAARDALVAIEKNTHDLARKIEELLALKNG